MPENEIVYLVGYNGEQDFSEVYAVYKSKEGALEHYNRAVEAQLKDRIQSIEYNARKGCQKRIDQLKDQIEELKLKDPFDLNGPYIREYKLGD